MSLLTFGSEISQHHKMMPGDYNLFPFGKASKKNVDKVIIYHINHMVELIN